MAPVSTHFKAWSQETMENHGRPDDHSKACLMAEFIRWSFLGYLIKYPCWSEPWIQISPLSSITLGPGTCVWCSLTSIFYIKKKKSKLHCCEARWLIIIIVTVITILVCNMPSTLPWEIVLCLNIYFASSLSVNSTKITGVADLSPMIPY